MLNFKINIMKTKKKIKLTPLFGSVVQLIMVISAILLIITSRESWPIIIVVLFFGWFLYDIAIGIFVVDECYDEGFYGACRHRIIKEKVLDSDVYFIQTKPLLPLFFLPWKGGAYKSFIYKKDDEVYLCNNAFNTKKEAYDQVENLKNRQEYKKLFFVKKIEIC